MPIRTYVRTSERAAERQTASRVFPKYLHNHCAICLWGNKRSHSARHSYVHLTGINSNLEWLPHCHYIRKESSSNKQTHTPQHSTSLAVRFVRFTIVMMRDNTPVNDWIVALTGFNFIKHGHRPINLCLWQQEKTCFTYYDNKTFF